MTTAIPSYNHPYTPSRSSLLPRSHPLHPPTTPVFPIHRPPLLSSINSPRSFAKKSSALPFLSTMKSPDLSDSPPSSIVRHTNSRDPSRGYHSFGPVNSSTSLVTSSLFLPQRTAPTYTPSTRPTSAHHSAILNALMRYLPA